MTVVEQWLASGQPAVIRGQRLRPRAHPLLPDTPLQETRGQGTIYRLDSDGTPWFLKSFLPSQRPQRQYVEDLASCIPRLPAFRCGWERRVLSSHDLTHVPGTFSSPDLAVWLDGTILMPQHSGEAWGDLLLNIADGGLQLSRDTRIVIARQLIEAILLLEIVDLSHRDLSSGNILVNLREEPVLSLIDWDTLFHPTLGFQTNTTVGTPGYIAPWLGGEGQRSWRRHADRFALAICVTEVLTVRQGTQIYGDGSCFEQPQLGSDQAALDRARGTLVTISLPLANLFQRAWIARSFDDCPAPADWIEALDSVESESGGPRAQLDAAIYEGWSAALDQARGALRAGERVDIDGLGAQHAGLEQLLTPGLLRLFDRDRAFAQAAAALRLTLARGDDAAIVRAAETDELDPKALRASEALQIEQARARMQALSELQRAMQAVPPDDDATVDAWWSALRAGCTIPAVLAEAARQARRRRITHLSKRAAEQSFGGDAKNVDADGAPETLPTSAPQEEVPAPAAVPDADTARMEVVGGLEAAIARGDAKEIASAAAAVRVARERIPANAWDAVAQATARVSGLDELRAARQSGDIERSALAWARADTLWRDGMTAEDDDAGREAFRRWGHMARPVGASEALGDES